MTILVCYDDVCVVFVHLGDTHQIELLPNSQKNNLPKLLLSPFFPTLPPKQMLTLSIHLRVMDNALWRTDREIVAETHIAPLTVTVDTV